MSSLAMMLVAPALLGIDFGWQPVAGGGIQYIIRLDAEQIESLKNGEDILSDMPANMDIVHTFIITAEPGQLPNQGKPPRRPEGSLIAAPGSSPGGQLGANTYPVNNNYPYSNAYPNNPSGNNYPGNSNFPISPPGGFTTPAGQQYNSNGQPVNGPMFPNNAPGGNFNNTGYSGPNQASGPRNDQNYLASTSGWNPNGVLASNNTSHFGASTSTFGSTPQPMLTNRVQDNSFVNQSQAPSVPKVIPNSAWVATIVALGLSLGANCYLGMLSVSLYNRCRVLLGQLRFSTLRG